MTACTVVSSLTCPSMTDYIRMNLTDFDAGPMYYDRLGCNTVRNGNLLVVMVVTSPFQT